MWRNHPSGSFKTNIAVSLANVVFCTSPHSYTARFPKTQLMPVGIPGYFFSAYKKEAAPKPRTVLSLGRLSPIKNVHVIVEACAKLPKDFLCTIVGDPTVRDRGYAEDLKQNGGKIPTVHFMPGVPHDKTAEFFATHEIMVNLTPDGSFDKTIFEAMAAGSLLITSNTALRGILPDEFICKIEPSSLTQAITMVAMLSPEQKQNYRRHFSEYVAATHSLRVLVEKVKVALS
jgi:glycosyltransferase involved in cell wall biosynthesis